MSSIPSWVISLISLVITTVITGVIGIVVKRTMSAEFNKQKELMDLRAEKEKRERNQELNENLEAKLSPIDKKIDKIQDKLDLDTDGTLSTLRNDILNCYYNCKQKGYRNDYDYTNIHDLFEAYERLGGNSFVKDVMGRFDNLPPEEEYKKQK